jgi:hypothetical protein
MLTLPPRDAWRQMDKVAAGLNPATHATLVLFYPEPLMIDATFFAARGARRIPLR